MYSPSSKKGSIILDLEMSNKPSVAGWEVLRLEPNNEQAREYLRYLGIEAPIPSPSFDHLSLAPNDDGELTFLAPAATPPPPSQQNLSLAPNDDGELTFLTPKSSQNHPSPSLSHDVWLSHPTQHIQELELPEENSPFSPSTEAKVFPQPNAKTFSTASSPARTSPSKSLPVDPASFFEDSLNPPPFSATFFCLSLPSRWCVDLPPLASDRRLEKIHQLFRKRR